MIWGSELGTGAWGEGGTMEARGTRVEDGARGQDKNIRRGGLRPQARVKAQDKGHRAAGENQGEGEGPTTNAPEKKHGHPGRGG